MRRAEREVLVMGAAGRIGRILHGLWPDGLARWQIRQTILTPDWITVTPISDPMALARAAEGSRVILCLSGVIPGARGQMADNIRLGLAAVRAASRVGARVCLASSAAVYGNQPGVLGEDGPLYPLTPYGRAKVQMEREAARLGADLGVPVTSLRIGNIAGVDSIIGGWKPGFRLDRFADGTSPRRSYIGLATLARVLRALVLRDKLPGVLNVAAPGLIGMDALLDAAGLAWSPQPAPASAIPAIALDTARLTSLVPVPEATPATLAAEWNDCRKFLT